jgi:hypothetical protein
MLDAPAWPQDLSTRASQDVVLGIVSKPPQRYRAADRLRFGRDHGIDAAPFEIAVDLAVGVAGIGRNCLHLVSGRRCRGVDGRDDDLALVHFAGGDLDVDDDPSEIVNDCMLFVGGFEATVSGVGRH